MKGRLSAVNRGEIMRNNSVVKLSYRRSGLLTGCLSVALMAAYFVTGHLPIGATAARPAGVGVLQLVAQAGSKAEDPPGVTITIGPEGLSPAEVTVTGERFLLSVDNRTDLQEVVLVLRRGGGEKVREIKVPVKAIDWSEQLDLAPGQ
jgi:hypothetical protein